MKSFSRMFLNTVFLDLQSTIYLDLQSTIYLDLQSTIYLDPCRCLRTPSIFTIVNLSIADFFMGIISYLRAGELTYSYCGLGHLRILNMSYVECCRCIQALLPMSYTIGILQLLDLLNTHRKSPTQEPKLPFLFIWANVRSFRILTD